MKNCFLFVLILFSIKTFGQTIPYATQQPKWVFPVYAKDATGKRDTIYLGYDPNASNGSASPDINMGEIWHPGVNDFSLGTDYWINPVDSMIKTEVRNSYLTYSIVLSQVVMPVTFYWDVLLMHSDSLPFPDQDPLPRAQLNIYFNLEQVVDEPGTTCNISYPIVISDTITTAACACYAKDTLKFIDYFGNANPQTFIIGFEFTPWVGHRPDLSVNEKGNKTIKVFPNPAFDLLFVTSDLTNEEYEVNIYDYTLKNLNHSAINISTNNPIDISYLKSGIYFLRFKNKSGLNKIVKIIKL